MNKKIIKGVALSLLMTSALAGVTMATMQPLMVNNQIVAEAATTYSENIKIQTKLKRWGYYTGAVDGIYGSQTKKAVRYFQSKNGLAVDGIVGPFLL